MTPLQSHRKPLIPAGTSYPIGCCVEWGGIWETSCCISYTKTKYSKCHLKECLKVW